MTDSHVDLKKNPTLTSPLELSWRRSTPSWNKAVSSTTCRDGQSTTNTTAPSSEMGINPSESMMGRFLELTMLSSAWESTFLHEDPRLNPKCVGGDEGGWYMFDSVREWVSWSFGPCESADPCDYCHRTTGIVLTDGHGWAKARENSAQPEAQRLKLRPQHCR
jgi:hypothetical protein